MSENYYLGIDASKGYADFVIIDEKKNVLKQNFQLDDTFTGHAELFTQLKYFCNDRPKAKIYAGIESTGGYENTWHNMLKQSYSELPVKIARLNPKGVFHSGKANLKNVTTDAISAINIAEYLINHSAKVDYDSEDYWADLRKQWKYIELLKKHKTALLNHLEKLLYSANPEILPYCKKGMPAWVLRLLKQYPTAEKLKRASVSKLSRIPYVTEERARNLVLSAKQSVASSGGIITADMIIAIVSQILELGKLIDKQEKIMIKNCASEEVELLKSLNGIGDVSAIGLIIEIGNIARFGSAKKLVSYFGLNPAFKNSGDRAGEVHMSKQGRKTPRKILFMVVLSALKCNPLIRQLYHRLKNRGMKGSSAIGVCMHKITRIIYGMLKNGTKFNPAIDKQNMEKSNQPQSSGKPSKSRRYQEYDKKAPISGRQAKKRAEGSSQNDKSLNTGSNLKPINNIRKKVT